MPFSGKKPNSRREATNVSSLPLPEWHRRTDAALVWLRRSIEATGGQGSSHSWSPLFGWAKSYPETTGYLIETLLNYAELKQDDLLRNLASRCANWLVSIQLPSGAFPGLLAGHKEPSVFNTAMILFGLSRKTSSPSAKESLGRAVDWLVSTLESDFSWRKHSYVPGFTPSYYTRAVWGVLQANQILQNPENEEKMRHALHFYARRFLPNGGVRDWGFWPEKPAFTHAMAYTLEGFLESAILLGEVEILQKTIASGERFLEVSAQAGNRTAGRYDERWRGDYSFLCVTGNCQFSVFFHRLWELSGEDKFRCAADSFLSEIIDFQYLGKNKNRFGGLPGSIPVWGPYLRFRYPNWGLKFFLDAMRLAYFRFKKV